jgi:CheY-like chemotaxis protein
MDCNNELPSSDSFSVDITTPKSFNHSSPKPEKRLRKSLPPSLRNVLVVDDSTMNRKMICKLFTKKGISCDQAEDGSIAVDMMKSILKSKPDSWNDTTTASDEIASLQHGNYDAILMDYQMPNMDGPTAIRAIRSLGYKGVVIGVTGNVMALDQQEMMAAGANDVLPKPFDIDKFWDAYNRTATNTQSFR